MQSQPNYPSQQRSPWFYVLWGCGGCACLAVIAAVAGVMLLGWGAKKGIEGMTDMVHEMQKEIEADLKVQSHTMVNKKGERYIEGTLKNVSPTHYYATVSVEFELYDKSGKLLKSTTAQTQGLKPEATWKFQAPINDPIVATYKYRGVDGLRDVAEDSNIDPATRQKMKEERAEMDARYKDLLKKTQEDSAKPNHP
ncbi:MAG: hypothetical protein JWL77_4020 [Chthonomonadaceae bacterium]|nr:hypothetical protein [Chthonomonadaceae bacterium]